MLDLPYICRLFQYQKSDSNQIINKTISSPVPFNFVASYAKSPVVTYQGITFLLLESIKNINHFEHVWEQCQLGVITGRSLSNLRPKAIQAKLHLLST